MLGKRPRPPMKRTTSMTEISFDLTNLTPAGPQNALDRRPAASPVSPGNRRRNSVDVIGVADFLRSCSLCKRRLIPGHDIYMYRGDKAFCSPECRQQQIVQDERKEKCSLASKKENTSTINTHSDVSSNGEAATVAAV